jgi:RNA polymerase sigma-70 factor (ECF subfamily)
MMREIPRIKTAVDTTPPDDGAVVADVLAGNREAYALLVRRYQDSLFRFACGMVDSPDIAADLVQESFVKAFTTLGRCREPGRFGAWLHRIVRNRCLDYLKRNRRQISLDGVDAHTSVEDGADEVLRRRELRAALSTALRRLPEAQRVAFLMKHLEERSYEEMAEELDTSVSALKMRVKRARETMRAILEESLAT